MSADNGHGRTLTYHVGILLLLAALGTLLVPNEGVSWVRGLAIAAAWLGS